MQPLGPRGSSGNTPLNALEQGEALKQKTLPNVALTSAQRTALERIIVKILAISSLKAPALWAGIRHHLGVSSDAELLSSHFPTAENWLNNVLKQEQNNHLARRQLQQLTDLLPQGNNRQAVSEFIRQQFGQTVLSALTQDQLQQVLTMLQQGKIAIPQPVQTSVTSRSLLPAENLNINQQVIKLSVANGESPISLWETLYQIIGLKNGDPIPSRHYSLLIQYLQARQALVNQQNITLPALCQCLKQPPTSEESLQVTRFCQRYYQLPDNQTMTMVQAHDLLNHLFSSRAGLAMAWENHSSTIPTSGPVPIKATSASPIIDAKNWITASRLRAVVIIVVLVLIAYWLF